MTEAVAEAVEKAPRGPGNQLFPHRFEGDNGAVADFMWTKSNWKAGTLVFKVRQGEKGKPEKVVVTLKEVGVEGMITQLRDVDTNRVFMDGFKWGAAEDDKLHTIRDAAFVAMSRVGRAGPETEVKEPESEV